jgi:dethiobiotin synthetase
MARAPKGRMISRWFITGTGTGVGKTMTTAALIAAWHADGVRALPVKPVQTGWNPDTHDLAFALTGALFPLCDEDRADLNLYRFALPASPHLAAAREGSTISLDRIATALDRLSRRWDVLVIEGAGGVLVPLDDTTTMMDLARAVHAAPVLVAASTLGTLNHTALSLRELERSGIPAAAVVVSDGSLPADDTDALIRADNLDRIRAMASPIRTAHLAHLPRPTPFALIQAGRTLLRALPISDIEASAT